MINIMEVAETNKMVEQENLDVRTITMGISLLDCAGPDLSDVCSRIYNKITSYAKDLVSTGEEIAREIGVSDRQQADFDHTGIACRRGVLPHLG
jgi:uncharacterized protein (UPF0210 family)